MTEVKLLDELATLNKINNNDFLSASSYIESILSSNVLRSLQNGENEIKFDIGIGELYIRIFSDSINYNFKPSKSLEEKIANSVTNNDNILISELNDKISLKLFKIYRELLK